MKLCLKLHRVLCHLGELHLGIMFLNIDVEMKIVLTFSGTSP